MFKLSRLIPTFLLVLYGDCSAIPNDISDPGRLVSTRISGNNTIIVRDKCVPEYKICSEKMFNFTDTSAVKSFTIDYCPKNVVQDKNSLDLVITQECGTALIYPQKIKYGKVEGRIKIAPGPGAVTAMILIGEEQRDEIDFEWVGKDLVNAQSMFFINGSAVVSGADFHQIPNKSDTDMSKEFHNYSIELTENSVKWGIDGVIVRTLEKESDDTFPSKANTLRFGVWNGSGSSDWAGVMNFTNGNPSGYFEFIKITQYC
ncbi:hypothetical protein BB559_001559 [Furculomyces boomerangus]|uniref:GH16 domain-containing protein n=1 Tax=Furculomyces boomerangus TaxID=61424 RepID=A0A2T9Z1H5_9FUNG|nr:hypothetical protein BB559_006817 [Furculomyces boomerangus]PVU98431.1 hypothetical protein BB559_001559 [Furculomyces boomerangus]